jgi:hypothetical protein
MTYDPARQLAASMRDECIALEAAARARHGGNYREIAEAAIAKVDEYSQRGELGLLYLSWIRDPND